MRQITVAGLLLVIGVLAAGPLFARVTPGNRHATEKGSLAVLLGPSVTLTSTAWDKDGGDIDLNGIRTSIPLVLGLSYGIIDGLDAGVDVSAVRNAMDSDTSLGAREFALGARYQIELGETNGLLLGAKFKIDMGPNPTPPEPGTSDQQNGLEFGIDYNVMLGRSLGLRLGTGLVLHFESADTKLQSGILIDPSIGLWVAMSKSVTLGIDVGYASQTDAKLSGNDVADSGYSIAYAAPWLLWQIGSSNALGFGLFSTDEDMATGIAIMGKNANANRIAVNLAWRGTFGL